MFKKILEKLSLGNVLYYPGCLTHFVLPDIEENYQKILRKLGINFIFLPEFNCCGSPVKHAGYKKDFEQLKEKNLLFFKKYGVSKIITNCPACFRVLSDYGLNVEHVTQTVWKNIKKIKTKHKGRITYHDPCHLGRHSNVYEEPRKILKHLGFTVVELPSCKERSFCCGGGAGLKSNYPTMSNDIAKRILSQVSTKKIVTPCPLCYKHFKENAPKDLKVLEFSEALI